MNDHISAEQAELNARGLAFAQTLARVISDFPEIVADADPAAGWSAREVVAEQWARTVRTHLEALEVPFLAPEASQILAMMESAYTVRALDGPPFEDAEMTAEILAEALGPEEAFERIMRVGSGFFPGWWKMLDNLWDSKMAEAGQPPSQRPDDWPPVTAMPEHAAKTPKGLATKWLEGAGSLLATATTFYQEVDPGPAVMTEEQQARARMIIRTIAVLDRKVDLLYESFSATAWDGLMVVLNELRALSRDLILHLSTDPDRRALGMNRGHIGLRAQVFGYVVTGERPDQAWASAIAEMRRVREQSERRR